MAIRASPAVDGVRGLLRDLLPVDVTSVSPCRMQGCNSSTYVVSTTLLPPFVVSLREPSEAPRDGADPPDYTLGFSLAAEAVGGVVPSIRVLAPGVYAMSLAVGRHAAAALLGSPPVIADEMMLRTAADLSFVVARLLNSPVESLCDTPSRRPLMSRAKDAADKHRRSYLAESERLMALWPHHSPGVADVARAVAPGANLPLSLCHGDLGQGNVMLHDNGSVSGVLDWWDVYVGPAGVDISALFWLVDNHRGRGANAEGGMGAVSDVFWKSLRRHVSRPELDFASMLMQAKAHELSSISSLAASGLAPAQRIADLVLGYTYDFGSL